MAHEHDQGGESRVEVSEEEAPGEREETDCPTKRRRWARGIGLGLITGAAVGVAALLSVPTDGAPEHVDTVEVTERRASYLVETPEVEEPSPASPARAEATNAEREATGAEPETVGSIGALSELEGAWNSPISPYGSSTSSGSDPASAIDALMGEQVGGNSGGLGLRGAGRGAGGLGNLGTIGRGSAGGGGHGGLGAAARNARVGPAARLEPSREEYEHIAETGFQRVTEHPLSTFSADVDTASYSNVRRFLTGGSLPPADAVRIEEMINYFDYDYAEPREGRHPFAVHTEVGPCPWNPSHRLLHVGIQGRRIAARDLPARNLVFLVDVSGSMNSPDKLPLLVAGLNLLVDDLRENDRVAIVVYAGAAGLALPSTRGTQRSEIRRALARLRAGGSTNGGQGIHLAYRIAQERFIRGGINRVILASDGDFNVGTTSQGELTRLIEERRRTGVFLTVLGFGRGNLGDHTMENLADRGNGNYAYIDTIDEARRVLVREASGTLWTIAQDVKLQLELNPATVESYRLIGYENRRLRAEEFNDDTRDAGEVGAGHSVTALYELVPVGAEPASANATPEVDALRYQTPRRPSGTAVREELATVKVRYKVPRGSRSILMTRRVRDTQGAPTRRFRFSAAVASFGMLLRGSEHAGDVTVSSVRELASGAMGADGHGDRGELLRLMARASELGLGRR